MRRENKYATGHTLRRIHGRRRWVHAEGDDPRGCTMTEREPWTGGKWRAWCVGQEGEPRWTRRAKGKGRVQLDTCHIARYRGDWGGTHDGHRRARQKIRARNRYGWHRTRATRLAVIRDDTRVVEPTACRCREAWLDAPRNRAIRRCFGPDALGSARDLPYRRMVYRSCGIT